MRFVVLRMLGKARHSTSHAALVVAAKGGAITLAVDMGVYTRNRCVHMYWYAWVCGFLGASQEASAAYQPVWSK